MDQFQPIFFFQLEIHREFQIQYRSLPHTLKEFLRVKEFCMVLQMLTTHYQNLKELDTTHLYLLIFKFEREKQYLSIFCQVRSFNL